MVVSDKIIFSINSQLMQMATVHVISDWKTNLTLSPRAAFLCRVCIISDICVAIPFVSACISCLQ